MDAPWPQPVLAEDVLAEDVLDTGVLAEDVLAEEVMIALFSACVILRGIALFYEDYKFLADYWTTLVNQWIN